MIREICTIDMIKGVKFISAIENGTIKLFSLDEGISLYIEKDGVYVDVSVAVLYGYNIPEIAYRIQQTVKQSVENMTHFKVAEVDVHVLDVVFGEQPHIEKEAEPHEEEEENS